MSNKMSNNKRPQIGQTDDGDCPQPSSDLSKARVMTGNIDVLLEKLSPGSLAHELVSKLKDSMRDEWPEVLKASLNARLTHKVGELMHGQDQAS